MKWASTQVVWFRHAHEAAAARLLGDAYANFQKTAGGLNGLGLVAELSDGFTGEAIGVGCLGCVDGHGDSATVITHLVVDPTHRRQGVGTLLVDALRRSNPTVSLAVAADLCDASATLFFRTCGFTDDATGGYLVLRP